METYLKIKLFYYLSKVFSFLVIKKTKKSINKNFFLFLYGGIGDHLILVNFIYSLSQKNNVTIFLDKKFFYLKFFFNECRIIDYDSNKKLYFMFKLLIGENFKNTTFISWSCSIYQMLIYLISNSSSYFGIIDSFDKIYDSKKIFLTKEKNRYSLYNKVFIQNLDIVFTKKAFYFQETKKIFTEKYFVIAINKTTNWGSVVPKLEIFLKKINYFMKDTQLIPVIIGINDHKKINLQLYEKLIHLNPLNMTGKLDFKNLIKLIYFAEYTICYDNGIMHLSSLLSKKTYSFFTFSDPNVYAENSNIVFFNKMFSCQPCISLPVNGNDNYPPKCLFNYQCSSSLDKN